MLTLKALRLAAECSTQTSCEHCPVTTSQLPRGSFCGVVRAIISGGQTGADRAALDWAIARGIPHGGWCPKGRAAEDGVIAARYQLKETESTGYRQRTKLNVRDSDGTLIVNLGELDGGTLQTRRFAESMRRPIFVIAAGPGVEPDVVYRVRDWIAENSIATLNVAGPRESKRPGIYRCTYDLLEALTSREVPEQVGDGLSPACGRKSTPNP